MPQDFLLSLNHDAKEMHDVFGIDEHKAEQLKNRLKFLNKKFDRPSQAIAAVAPTCETIEEFAFILFTSGTQMVMQNMESSMHVIELKSDKLDIRDIVGKIIRKAKEEDGSED